MNMMMPISHRLYVAAVSDGLIARKPRGAGGRPAVIEVDSAGRPARDGNRKQSRPGSVPGRWGAGFRVF